MRSVDTKRSLFRIIIIIFIRNARKRSLIYRWQPCNQQDWCVLYASCIKMPEQDAAPGCIKMRMQLLRVASRCECTCNGLHLDARCNNATGHFYASRCGCNAPSLHFERCKNAHLHRVQPWLPSRLLLLFHPSIKKKKEKRKSFQRQYLLDSAMNRTFPFGSQ